MFREIIPFKSQEESIQQIKNRPNLSLGNASDAYVSDSRSLLSISLLIITVLLVFYRNSRQFFNTKYMYFIIAIEVPLEEVSVSVEYRILLLSKVLLR